METAAYAPEFGRLSDKRFRRFIWERDGGVCGICHRPVEFEAMSIDHVLARIRGGNDHVNNLRTAHRHCNSRRGPGDRAPKNEPAGPRAIKGDDVSVKEAARRLGVSRPHVYALIQRGVLRARKHPTYLKGTWVRVEDVDALALKINEPDH